jgi:phosphoribosylaminoimidazolecarboxamide formyltransferase/IMP cyclohydrolase
MNLIPIKNCLISVSNKTGLLEFAQFLAQNNINIISTGGTFNLLKQYNIKACEIADFTGFPEILDGRVKTLHPKVHGGLLAIPNNAEHQKQSQKNNLESIDLLVVNLYPFIETVAKTNSIEEIIENIDIGGPAMIRSAGKNFAFKTVITDHQQYLLLQEELQKNNFCTSLVFRQQMANQAFGNIATYDLAIANWFSQQNTQTLHISSSLKQTLRYGENSHQKAWLYIDNSTFGLANARVLQGKELSYNNYNDAEAALSLVGEFSQPACVIVKHNNACGVAVANDVATAFQQAFLADSKSAYGGIVAFNKTLDLATAVAISAIFFEVIIAPNISKEAQELLANKKNLRVLLLENASHKTKNALQIKSISGGFLVQEIDNILPKLSDLNLVSQTPLTEHELLQLLFALTVCKHIKSNAIVVANNYQTYGIGVGQTNRVDACLLACQKAQNFQQEGVVVDMAKGSFLASDAFFPFADNIEIAHQYGIKGIIAPAGSIRDQEVINKANQLGISLYFINTRHFRH